MDAENPTLRQGGTILIADDDVYARQMLKTLLSHEGHTLLEATNGDEAVSMALEHLPDLVLLDVIMLPGADGFVVCGRLRAEPQTREMPILLITSLNDRESRLRGLSLGADGFVSKPFDHAELLAQVRTIVKLNRYRHLLREQERYQRLVSMAPDGIAAVSADGRILLANPALARLLALRAPAQLIGRALTDYLAAESVESYHKLVAALALDASAISRGELMLVTAQKSRTPVEFSISRCDSLEQGSKQLIFRDITERKAAEAQIQRQMSQLTNLHAIGLAITASLDLHSTLARLIEHVHDHLGVDAASVLLLNTRTKLLESAAAKGVSLPAGTHFLVRPDEGLPGTVFQTQRSLMISSFTDRDVRSVRDRVLAARFGSYFALPLCARGETLGVLEIMRHDNFSPDRQWWLYLEALAVQTALAIHTATLFAQLQAANSELLYAYNATIEGWSRALDLHDHETEGHSVRVTELTLQLARRLRLGDEAYDHVRRGALLHDIGKMGVPDRILLKPGPLSAEEWAVMRKHPVYAYEWLSLVPFLQPALDIPYAHHERWDGSGYPRGLKGEAIPLMARIFAVVDVWDALRSERPYRSPWPEETVIDYLKQLAGVHFDPLVVQAFVALLQERSST